MSAGKFTFKICTGIIKDRARWSLFEVAGGETRSSSVRRGMLLDRRIDNFFATRNGETNNSC